MTFEIKLVHACVKCLLINVYAQKWLAHAHKPDFKCQISRNFGILIYTCTSHLFALYLSSLNTTTTLFAAVISGKYIRRDQSKFGPTNIPSFSVFCPTSMYFFFCFSCYIAEVLLVAITINFPSLK